MFQMLWQNDSVLSLIEKSSIRKSIQQNECHSTHTDFSPCAKEPGVGLQNGRSVRYVAGRFPAWAVRCVLLRLRCFCRLRCVCCVCCVCPLLCALSVLCAVPAVAVLFLCPRVADGYRQYTALLYGHDTRQMRRVMPVRRRVPPGAPHSRFARRRGRRPAARCCSCGSGTPGRCAAGRRSPGGSSAQSST